MLIELGPKMATEANRHKARYLWIWYCKPNDAKALSKVVGTLRQDNCVFQPCSNVTASASRGGRSEIYTAKKRSRASRAGRADIEEQAKQAEQAEQAQQAENAWQTEEAAQVCACVCV